MERVERYKKVSPGGSYVLKVGQEKKRITRTEVSAKVINKIRKGIVSDSNILSIEEKLADELLIISIPLRPQTLAIRIKKLEMLKMSYRKTYPSGKLPGKLQEGL